LRRTLSWYTRIVPVADDATALAPAFKILERGDKLIWFPEGARSLDGELQAFKPGIGGILTRCDVPVVPVFIEGAHAAFPASKTMPRLRARVVVRIGSPETAERLGLKEGGNEDINRVADALRQRVMKLRDQSRP
jgi:long-chain acyl-CoA synthetase